MYLSDNTLVPTSGCGCCDGILCNHPTAFWVRTKKH